MRKRSTVQSIGIASEDGRTQKTYTGKKRGRKPRNLQAQQQVQQLTPSKGEKTLKGVFEDLLKDIFSAEKQLIKAMPKMIEATTDRELKDAFDHHLQVTERQAKRIERVFSLARFNLESEKCAAMEGLIEEVKKVISHFSEGPVRDAALIIAVQKIEHYEIAAYGSLRTLANVIGYHKVADILDLTLEEEEMADEELTDLAEFINEDALYAVHEEELY